MHRAPWYRWNLYDDVGSTQEAVEGDDHDQAGAGQAAKPAAGGRPHRRRHVAARLRPSCVRPIEGREHEFVGIGFIAVGVLLGLAIYLDLAGPLGRGVETVVGWLTGLGRYVVPVALVAVGVALVGKGRSVHRFRLAIGWGLLGLSLLGLLHVVRGPEKIMADFDTLGRAGGWIGALVGEPLRGLIASGGAIVVLVAAVRRWRAAAHRRHRCGRCCRRRARASVPSPCRSGGGRAWRSATCRR